VRRLWIDWGVVEDCGETYSSSSKDEGTGVPEDIVVVVVCIREVGWVYGVLRMVELLASRAPMALRRSKMIFQAFRG